MIYIYIYNCNWVDTRWQQYSSHLHTNSTQNTPNGTYITIFLLFTFIFFIAFYFLSEMLLFSLKQQEPGDALCLLLGGDLIIGVLYEAKQIYLL
jgi:hypothetical protein